MIMPRSCGSKRHRVPSCQREAGQAFGRRHGDDPPAGLPYFSATGRGITLVNIAFPTETIDFLRSRYFGDSNLYFWCSTLLPFHIKLSQDIVKDSLREPKRR